MDTCYQRHIPSTYTHSPLCGSGTNSNDTRIETWKLIFYLRFTYLNFVILADWHSAHIVLLSQFLWERCRHQLPTNVGRGREVPLTVLASVRSNVLVELHFANLLLSENHTKIQKRISNREMVSKLSQSIELNSANSGENGFRMVQTQKTQSAIRIKWG